MSELSRLRLAVRIGRIAALASVLLIGSIACAAPPQSDVLKNLPNVAIVEAKPIDKPTHYIIHVLDWHVVDKDAYIADLRDQGISEDLDAKYTKHLDDVEAVQSEQKALLRALIEKHGVTAVYVEGVTKQDLPVYEARLKKVHSLGEKLQLLRKIADKIDDEDLAEKVKAGDAALRSELLRIGAAGQLQSEGTLKTHAAEDETALQAARPVGDDGKVKLDPKLIEARENAMVKIVMTGGPVSVLILGGAHDLSDNVPDDCQYIRVGTEAYQKMVVGP